MVRAATASGEPELLTTLQAWHLRPEEFRYPWQTGDPHSFFTWRRPGENAVGRLPAAVYDRSSYIRTRLPICSGLKASRCWTPGPETTTARSPTPGWPRSGGSDDEKLRDRGVSAERVSTVLAYEQQSAGYDAEAGGGLFAADEPVVAEYLGGREPGVALDAACGTGTRGSVITARGPAGEPCIAATYRHQLGDYLRPALRLGFQVRRCEEPRTVPSASRPLEPAAGIGDWQDWPWSLMDYLPSAARAAGGHPSLVIWHFRLPAS